MFIVGVGTAVPQHRYTQLECWEAFRDTDLCKRLEDPARDLVRKVLTSGKCGITTRHLALSDLSEGWDLTPDALHARFCNHAPKLAADACSAALSDAQIEPAAIDALLVSTCTGYLCPGLTSYVGQLLGLRSDVLGLDLVGQGCGAALPNLRTAETLLASGRAGRVLSVCVEICSAAFYFDNDPGTLISACLFGDGAGAAVLSDAPGSNGHRRLRWMTSRSLHDPAARELLRFETRGGMLRNILSPLVPELAADRAEQVLAQTLRDAGVEQGSIACWVFHPGGRDVIIELKRRLGLGMPSCS
jgi:alkylresorcinol/alkylpyrone synthase